MLDDEASGTKIWESLKRVGIDSGTKLLLTAELRRFGFGVDTRPEDRGLMTADTEVAKMTELVVMRSPDSLEEVLTGELEDWSTLEEAGLILPPNLLCSMESDKLDVTGNARFEGPPVLAATKEEPIAADELPSVTISNKLDTIVIPGPVALRDDSDTGRVLRPASEPDTLGAAVTELDILEAARIARLEVSVTLVAACEEADTAAELSPAIEPERLDVAV